MAPEGSRQRREARVMLISFAEASRKAGHSAQEWLDVAPLCARFECEEVGLDELEKIANLVWRL
jgi:hypothetical protein